MNTNYNRIKVADLETNQRNKILKTNENGELEFSDISQKEYDPVSATTAGIVDNTVLQELGGVDKTINGIKIGRGNSNYENNLVVGRNGLASVTTGQYNVAIGNGDGTTEGPLQYLTTGNGNTVIGSDSGIAITTGSSNTAIGGSSLFSTTTGAQNTAIGKSALYANTIGVRNTAIGQVALYNNVSGSRNTAIGDSALFTNTTGDYNVAVGNSCLANNTTGAYNTAVGRTSLNANTTGSSNVAVGSSALVQNTSGKYNTAIGIGTLQKNTIGTNNVALGSGALIGAPSTSGENSRNIAVGANAGNGLVAGNDNIFVGGDIPDSANVGFQNGNRNIEIGRLNNTLYYGSNNVIIGWAVSPATNLNNNIILADGDGNIALRKTDTNQLLAPTLTKALIASGGLTSLVNKDYTDNNLPTMVTLNAAPTAATALGTKGDIRIDNDYVYVCVNTNTWKRSALATW